MTELTLRAKERARYWRVASSALLDDLTFFISSFGCFPLANSLAPRLGVVSRKVSLRHVEEFF
jgi:hypothetical protein